MSKAFFQHFLCVACNEATFEKDIKNARKEMKIHVATDDHRWTTASTDPEDRVVIEVERVYDCSDYTSKRRAFIVHVGSMMRKCVYTLEDF